MLLSPQTFLPMAINGTIGGETVTTSIKWLAPTAANRALLVAPIPHGFKKVAGPGGVFSQRVLPKTNAVSKGAGAASKGAGTSSKGAGTSSKAQSPVTSTKG